MDGIASWSAFEQQQHPRDRAAPGASTSANVDNPATHQAHGIEALYVSPSSSEIAPSASTLIRQSALTATATSPRSGDAGEAEFRLRFHWMRPHPSLALALQDDAMMHGEKFENHHEKTNKIGNANTIASDVVEAAHMMDAYHYAQWNKMKQKQEPQNANADASKGDTNEDQGESDKGKFHGTSNFFESCTRKESSNNDGEQSACNKEDFLRKLPLEMPTLRINLANLVDPPLMSSWLPGEDTGIVYDSCSDTGEDDD